MIFTRTTLTAAAVVLKAYTRISCGVVISVVAHKNYAFALKHLRLCASMECNPVANYYNSIHSISCSCRVSDSRRLVLWRSRRPGNHTYDDGRYSVRPVGVRFVMCVCLYVCLFVLLEVHIYIKHIHWRIGSDALSSQTLLFTQCDSYILYS